MVSRSTVSGHSTYFSPTPIKQWNINIFASQIKLLLIKPMKYQHFWLPNQEIAYSTNTISSQMVNIKCFWKKCINKWTSESLLEENLHYKVCSIRFRPPEPLKHSYSDEIGPDKIEKIEIFQKYLRDFAIYIKNVDSEFNTLTYDL